MKTKRGSGVWYCISSYCNTVLGELTDVIKYAAVPFAELPDLCPPVLGSSHSRVELAKSELPRTQVRTLHTWYWETAKMSPIKRSRCFVVGCNNEYSSRHLLPTSEPLKTQRINVTFALKWMRRSPIYINASMFAQIIHDPALSTEEVSKRVFMNLCKSPFLIMY